MLTAELRQQNFGMVSRAFIRVVDDLSNQEMCRFDLTEEASLLNTMVSFICLFVGITVLTL